MGQVASSKPKKASTPKLTLTSPSKPASSRSQPTSAASTPAPAPARRVARHQGDATPIPGRNSVNVAAKAAASAAPIIAPMVAPLAAEEDVTLSATETASSAQVSSLKVESDVITTPQSGKNEAKEKIGAKEDGTMKKVELTDEDEDYDDSDDLDPETFKEAQKLVAKAKEAEAKRREEEDQLKLALDEERFLEDGPAINDKSLQEVLCYLKDKGGGIPESKNGNESDSDSDCPDLVDEEDGPIAPDLTDKLIEALDEDPHKDMQKTDLMMKMKKGPIIMHEVDIFNPVKDPVKLEVMMRAKESLSLISDAVFSPIKAPIKDTMIPVSDIKVIDPQTRNMSAAVAFEQLDIDATLTEEEKVRKALDEYEVMMGAADKLIQESRAKAADADQQRDFLRMKADAKIEEAKKRANDLEHKKKELEIRMEAHELEMKARKMKDEATKMKEDMERRKQKEADEAALRELEDIEEEPIEEEEAQKEEEMVAVEAEAPPAEVLFIPADEEIPEEMLQKSEEEAVMEEKAAEEETSEDSAVESSDLSSLLQSLDALAAKGDEMAFEQNKTMSILKPLVSDMLLNIEEKEAQLEDLKNAPVEKDAEEIPRLDQQDERLVQGLADMYFNKFLFDFVLVVEGKGIPCHKCVLYASSPYFRQYFEICEKPKEEHSMKIADLHHDSVARIVDYMYTNQLTVNAVRVRHLFDAAVFFEMQAVITACEDCVRDSIHVKTAIDYYRFFKDRESEAMRKFTVDYILDRFPLISLGKEFLDLTPEELLAFISSDHLNVEFEEFAFEAVMHWVSANVEERVDSLLQLLQQVRFLFMNSEYISESVATHHLIQEKLPCRALISSAKIAKLSMTASTDIDAGPLGFSITPRLGMFHEDVVVFVGGGDIPSQRSLYCYHPHSKDVFYLAKPAANRQTFKHTLRHHRVVSTGANKVFCIGGVLFDTDLLEDGNEKYVSLDCVLTLDMQTKAWTQCAPMPSTRCNFAAVSLGSKIFVFGGKTSYHAGSTLDSALCYDADEDVWTSVAALPRPAYSLEAIVYEDAIYILGGISEYGHSLDTVYKYHPDTDSYETLPPMAQARAGFGVTLIEDNVLVLGGYTLDKLTTNLQESEMYKPRKKSWLRMPEFPEDRRDIILFFHNSTLFAGGGSKVIASRTRLGAKTVFPSDLFRFDREQMAWVRDNKFIKNMNSDGWALCRFNTKRLQRVK